MDMGLEEIKLLTLDHVHKEKRKKKTYYFFHQDLLQLQQNIHGVQVSTASVDFPISDTSVHWFSSISSFSSLSRRAPTAREEAQWKNIHIYI